MDIRKFAARAAVGAVLMGGVALAGAPAFAYGPTGNTAAASSTTVSPGGTITISGTLACANCPVNIYLDSTANLLASTMTNASGAFSATVTIPSGYSGYNTLMAVASNGATATTTIDVIVPAATPTSTLATTGADVAGAVGVAAVAIGAGGGLVLLSRKRRAGQLS